MSNIQKITGFPHVFWSKNGRQVSMAKGSSAAMCSGGFLKDNLAKEYPLVMTNIAMENGPSIVDLPINGDS